MPLKTISTGSRPKARNLFFWAETQNNLNLFEEWVEGELTSAEQEKLARLLRVMFSQNGPLLHPSKEKYRKEFSDIWAIKSGQIRLLGTLRSSDFYILHYLRKKTNKLSKNDRLVALSHYDKFIAEIEG